MRDELVVWFDQPPKVSLGAYKYISSAWGSKVIFVVDHHFGDHRKLIKWDESDYGSAEMVFLSDCNDETRKIESIFSAYPNAIHVLNGFSSTIQEKIKRYIMRDGIKLAIMTEKPLGSRRNFTIQKLIRNTITPIKYRRIYSTYKDYVGAVLPLGVWGKELFESYGWPKEKVFSYMYCPELQPIRDATRNTDKEEIRFLYVGRLNFKARGLDVIMKAFNQLVEHNWHLDIVGGYGEKKEEVASWAESKEHVSFLGPWPADEVGRRMQDYDVYVAPTKADGWMAQINEAINAGMGIIVTDEAVSDELVRASGAGMVVRAADYKALYRAIDMAVKDVKMVDKWRQNARAYRARIRESVVGDYFISILDYVFYNRGSKPVCPWL